MLRPAMVCGRAKHSDLKILVELLSLIVRMLRPYNINQTNWALPTLQLLTHQTRNSPFLQLHRPPILFARSLL
jgi:hypothetical protein